MQEPFPVLKSLWLDADEEMGFDIPDAFLGGSAPLLQWIALRGVRFPNLLKLLSSASNLVHLGLGGIPMTGEGHISPNAMITCLSVLTKLRSLAFSFLQTSSPYPTDQRPPPSEYAILPVLTSLSLRGPHGYLEDIISRVDAPLLNTGYLSSNDEPMFDTPRVPQFIHRVKAFKSHGGFKAHFRREWTFAEFKFHSSIGPAVFSLSFPCSGLPAQVAITERICAQWPSVHSHIEFLELDNGYFVFEVQKGWEDITPWLRFLRPFTAVRTLRLCGIVIVPHVTCTLGRLEGERVTEVLPALRTIEVECSDPNAQASEILHILGPFLVAREESEHPVVVNVGYESL